MYGTYDPHNSWLLDTSSVFLSDPQDMDVKVSYTEDGTGQLDFHE